MIDTGPDLMWGANEPVALEDFPGICEQSGFRFEAFATPGHSRDHMVYFEPGNGWLFSGDLYLSHHIKYFHTDEYMAEQIDSLKKVLALDFDALFCGHRPQPQNGRARIRQKLQFLEDFAGRVTELAKGGMDETAIMKALHLREQRLIKWMCFGNVSMKNMVRSTIRAINK